MNIFIDTNILFKDPFWNGNYYSELLDIVKDKEVNIYIADVVLKELEKNYSNLIDEENNLRLQINERNRQFRFNKGVVPLIDKSDAVGNLLQFYRKLQANKSINVLNYKDDYLPEILDRAVWKRKPFTEKKTELKDAIIWLTFSKYVEENKMTNCFFITENFHDFCDTDKEKLKKKIYDIDKELENDTKRFKVYVSIKSLIQSENETLQKTNQRFLTWLENQNINSLFVFDLIKENFQQHVEQKVRHYIQSSEPSTVLNLEYYLSGLIEVDDIELIEVDNELNFDAFKDEAIISGVLFVQCNATAYQYNPNKDYGEDSYRYHSERTVTVGASFSFAYNKKKTVRNFDIDGIEMV